MIILLNGPFGVGKTTAARLLLERLPRAVLHDPEVIGSYLMRSPLKAVKPVDDYQDYLLWRILTIAMVRLQRAIHARPLVVPMSITRREYYDAITEGFRRADPGLVCFRLIASRDTLHARITASHDVQARQWRLEHLERGIASFQDPAFGLEVQTDGLSPDEVADRIMSLLP